jgi:hypothetical protein
MLQVIAILLNVDGTYFGIEPWARLRSIWLHWNIILWNSQMISCKTSVRLARLCVDFNVLGSIQTSETWDLNEFTSLKIDQWILLDSWMEVVRLPGNISLLSISFKVFYNQQVYLYPLNSLGYDVIVSCCCGNVRDEHLGASIKFDGTDIWRRQQQLSPGGKHIFHHQTQFSITCWGK